MRRIPSSIKKRIEKDKIFQAQKSQCFNNNNEAIIPIAVNSIKEKLAEDVIVREVDVVIEYEGQRLNYSYIDYNDYD